MYGCMHAYVRKRVALLGSNSNLAVVVLVNGLDHIIHVLVAQLHAKVELEGHLPRAAPCPLTRAIS